MYYPPQMLRRASLDDLEQSTCDLAPQLEHRIVMIQNEEVRERVNISEKFHKLIFWLCLTSQHHRQLLYKKETHIMNSTITEAEDE